MVFESWYGEDINFQILSTISMPDLIRTNALRKVYGKDAAQTTALENITFSIPLGEFVAIMGPSGSGKSTLLHILGFLDRQTSGTYYFDGIASDEYKERDLARLRNERIGFVFQAFNLLPKTSVFENVQLPLVYSRMPKTEWRARVDSAIEAVHLTLRARHESGMLSGGEKQRCAIARALVMKPDLIFADEPTGNLDSVSGKAVMEILQTLHKKHGHTIILITHEQQTAEHAERIVTIKDGKIESDMPVPARRFAVAGFQK
jgi:putative ABC transport system ATP-binding protein